MNGKTKTIHNKDTGYRKNGSIVRTYFAMFLKTNVNYWLVRSEKREAKDEKAWTR